MTGAAAQAFMHPTNRAPGTAAANAGPPSQFAQTKITSRPLFHYAQR
jgi:hypothetical protein